MNEAPESTDPSSSGTSAFIVARTHLKNQQPEKAEDLLRALVRDFPENLAFRESLLEAIFQQNRKEEMLRCFLECTEHFNPTNDNTYHGIYINALRATSNSPVPLRRLLRFYELVRQFQSTRQLSGDVAECGCFLGMSSYLLCSYLRLQNAGFDGSGYHIFDSFQGLSAPTTDDAVSDDHPDARRLRKMSGGGKFSASLKTVRKNLSAFPEIEFHPGWIPLAFRDLPDRDYRFVHVDVDHYDPTWDCLEYFYPRLAVGGLLVSDDYGWPGAQKAIGEFCAQWKIEFEITGYQQAVLMKT